MNETNQLNAYSYVGENIKEIQKNSFSISINTLKKIYIPVNKIKNKVDEKYYDLQELEENVFITTEKIQKKHFINIIDFDIKDEYIIAKGSPVIISNETNNENVENKIDSFFSSENIKFKSTVTQFRFNKDRPKFILQPNILVKTKFSFFTNNNNEDFNNSIKGFTFICQKGNYVELNLNFRDNDTIVETVSNLPDGLIFINGKIKGTPLKSGITVFSITTNKNEIIECNIEVPDLVRLL